MIKLKNIQKSHSHKITSIYFFIFFFVAACGNSRRPGLSDKELFAQRKVEAPQETDAQAPDVSDMETYTVPPGIKYKESRAVDPAHPPVVIDIETALNGGAKDIPLSSIGQNVKYIKVTIPDDLHVQDFVIKDDTLFVVCRGNTFSRMCMVLPYTLEGRFMKIIWNVTPKGIIKEYHPDIVTPDASKSDRSLPSTWSEIEHDIGERIFHANFSYTGKELQYTIYRSGERDHPEYSRHIVSSLNGLTKAVSFERFNLPSHTTVYQSSIGWIHVHTTADQWLKKQPWCLITFSSRCDTLCRFVNHVPFTSFYATAISNPDKITVYFYNDRFTFRTNYADTVFCLTAPDRILPVYVMHSGKYKLFATEGLKGQIGNKVYIEKIRETQRFLFISVNTPAREKQTLVYDKQQQTLRLNRNENLSNDIDRGPAFFPEKIMPDGKTMACSFRSDYFQNNPSNMFPSIAKNSVVFMIVQ